MPCVKKHFNPFNSLRHRVCKVLEVLGVHVLDPHILDGLLQLPGAGDGAVLLEPPLHVELAVFHRVEIGRVARAIYNGELIFVLLKGTAA